MDIIMVTGEWTDENCWLTLGRIKPQVAKDCAFTWNILPETKKEIKRKTTIKERKNNENKGRDEEKPVKMKDKTKTKNQEKTMQNRLYHPQLGRPIEI